MRTYYGRPRNLPHRAPLDELVLTILSQNTNDRNRDVAYARLRGRFPTWEAAARAPAREIERAIRPGGISKVKSERIKQILALIRKRPPGIKPRGGFATGHAGSEPAVPIDASVAWLAEAPRERALEFLEALPGVGRKTAACVLLFSYGRPEFPVDTHVYRVSSRLGLIRPKASFNEAHDTLRLASEPDEVYELHVNLIRHGRRLCKPRNPLCKQCPLLRLCPYGREAVRSSRPLKAASARPRRAQDLP